MTNAALLLWPLLGFFTVAALAAWWQARNARREMDSADRLLSRDPMLPPSQQEKFRAKQDEIGSFRRSKERRATLFAALALATLLYLLLVD